MIICIYDIHFYDSTILNIGLKIRNDYFQMVLFTWIEYRESLLLLFIHLNKVIFFANSISSCWVSFDQTV